MSRDAPQAPAIENGQSPEGQASFAVTDATELPVCNAARRGAIAHIQSTNEIVSCGAAGWAAVVLPTPAPGKDGVNGKDGRDGKDGAAGVAGAKGEKGDKGEPGEAGLTVAEQKTVFMRHDCSKAGEWISFVEVEGDVTKFSNGWTHTAITIWFTTTEAPRAYGSVWTPPGQPVTINIKEKRVHENLHKHTHEFRMPATLDSASYTWGGCYGLNQTVSTEIKAK